MDFEEYMREQQKELDKIFGIPEPIRVISKRPARDTPINKEDIINLKIALATSKDVNDVIEQIF